MNIVGTASYLSAAGLFLVLTLLLVTSWRGRLQGALLVAACIVTTLWGVFHGLGAGRASMPLGSVFLAEIVRDGAWLVFLTRLITTTRARMPRLLRFGVHSAWLLLLAYVLFYQFGRELPLARELPVGIPVVGLLLLALAGLVLVEQLYRNAPTSQRWALKFLCIGLGAMFGYDLFMYSDAVLFHGMPKTLWDARGFTNAMVVPLLAVSAARNPTWSLDVFVSRRMVFYSTSLLVAGVYLLAMALGGYYIRLYGGTWGSLAAAVFVFGAVLALIVTAFSGQARARIRVFLNKHFFNYRYDYREEWLRLINTLSGHGARMPLPERCVMALAQIPDSPGGMLWLKGQADEYAPRAHWNMGIPEDASEPAGSALIQFLGQGRWILDVDQYRRDPSLYGLAGLPSWIDRLPQAWALVPLMEREGLMGFIVLARPRAPLTLNWEDSDLLLTVGRQLASHLGQHEAARQLTEARQFEGYNRLTAFVMHDLKNVIAQQSLLVTNAGKHKANPAFVDDMVNTINNSVRRMRHLLEQLTGAGVSSVGRRVRLDEVLRSVTAECADRKPVPAVAAGTEPAAAIADPERLASVLAHLVRNAQDATPPDGSVELRLFTEGAMAVIEVADTGSGMDARFIREKLFQPFYTTKASKGMGIGAYQVREYVISIGGNVEVLSVPGQGTRFVLKLPLAPAIEEAQPVKRMDAAS